MTRNPSLDIDPFSDAFLSDPYPYHEILRETGAAVWLEPIGVWAMARHEHVTAALRDWEAYCSSAGVGLSDFTKEEPWRPPSIILEADPPLHTKSRNVLGRIMTARALESLRPEFEAQAETLIDELLERGRFDAVRELAEAYPLRVFPDAVGLPDAGREHLLPYGNMVFNVFGPRNHLFEAATALADPVRETIARLCARESLAPGGLGAQIYGAADTGELSDGEAGLLVRSLLSAGLDTTVIGLGNTIWCCAEHPGQFQALRANPDLARAMFDEVIRFESPVQTFFRTTTRAIDVDGTTLDAGEKVLLFLGAANRDPRRWDAPERFEIERKTIGHVAYGSGIHACVGQNVARMEAEAVLRALARRVQSIDLDGEPERRLNNTLRGFAKLYVRLR
ncbi:MAG: cytochrome P450 [Gammaproteobacteria bacterium]|nr:cytochrome P450 [Gammaproteobacteria bacterium]